MLLSYGIIAADSSLNLDDYRAVERTFQTIVQASGRAGREKEKGRVIIQTYNPDSYAIIYAKNQDYDSFYKTEINLRKILKNPPFCDIILIRFSGENIKEIEESSKIVYQNLKNSINPKNSMIYKPVPAPVDKIKNKYRWRIVIKGKVNNSMIDIINNTLEKTEHFKNTTISVNINPSNMN